MRPLIFAIGSMVLLSACGTKGALTLPPKPQQAQPAEATTPTVKVPVPAANNPSTAKEQP